MKKRLFTSFLLLLVICLSFSATAFAETTPINGDVISTEPVVATEAPVNTDAPVDTGIATDPYSPTNPIDTGAIDTAPTDFTSPATSEATSPAETTVPVSTAPVTNPPEPTEPDEDSTYSDYVSPDPIYTPADQDFEENDWQAIELNIDAAPSNGKGSFEFIQNNNTKGNDSVVGFLIVGLVLIFLSIAGFTFVILYRPYKKKATAKAGARHSSAASNTKKSTRNRTNNDNRRTYNPDDYNDGF